MPKDSEILRDLIFMWDPENFLVKGSKQRTNAWNVMGTAAAVKRPYCRDRMRWDRVNALGSC